MAGTVGAIVFVVIVFGGLGSLAGAFIASIMLGLVDAFGKTSDVSLAAVLAGAGIEVSPQTFGYPVLAMTVAQVAPVLPYLLLVLMLIFRPRGLMGTRES
jgi:branched-chain amino acid transport system permease protein